MASVDNKIVNMKFNNKQFEDGISTTLATLGKLKAGLNMTDAAKSFDDVEKAANKVTLNGIQKSLDVLTSRFSTFGIMGMQVLQNITDMAMNAGTKMAKSLTVAPMMEGLQEYETQINAIQTIMTNTASKGTNLDQVNSALEELNKYADMTIYNFTEMTRNIGTFTAAGVDLDTSVGAIKGIANLAAASGSTSQQASTAMYQLSQALSSGTVKLQDWNSVVNAGMGGQLFQDSLMETARVHGIGIDSMIKEEGSFRETLSKGWLTSSILTETLSKFTGDLTQEQLISMGYTQEQAEEVAKLGTMANDAATKVKTLTQLGETLGEAVGSGWAQTWQTLIGDFDEAKELFTGISTSLGGIIDASSNARNTMLKGWKDLGGRTKLIEAFSLIFRNIGNIARTVGEAFREIFPATTSAQLFSLTEGFHKLAEKLWLNDAPLEQIHELFKGFFTVVKVGVNIVIALAKAVGYLISFLFPVIKVIFSAASAIGKLINEFADVYKATKTVGSEFETFGGILKFISQKFSDFMNGISDGIQNLKLTEFAEQMARLASSFNPVETAVGILNKGFTSLKELVIFLKPYALMFADQVGKAFNWLGDTVKGAIDNFSFDRAMDIGGLGAMGLILLSIRKFTKGLKDGLESAGGFLDGVVGILDGVKGSLEAWQTSLKADALLKLAGAIAILSVSLLVLSTIDPVKLIASLSAMGVMFAELTIAMGFIAKINKGIKGQVGIIATTTALILFSTALLILAGAVKKMSEIPATSMMKGIYGISLMMGALVLASKYLETQSKGMVKTGLSLMILAVAIRLLVKPIKELSVIPFSSLVKSLGALGVMLGALALFTKHAKFEKGAISSGIGLMFLAKAIAILAGALTVISAIKATSLAKATAAISAIILVLGVFTKINDGKGMISTGIGMIFLAKAMEIITGALERLSIIPYTSLAKSLIAFAAAMGIVTLALNLIPSGAVAKGAGLALVAVGVNLLATALQSLSVIPYTSLAKAVLALGASLTIMAVALMMTSGTLSGAAAILILAAALNILIPPLLVFSNMTKTELMKSILMLASVFGVFGIAGYALAPVTPILIALSAAIALFGVAIAAIGIGILAFSAGLTMLAASGAAGMVAMKFIMIEVATILPVVLTALADAITAFVVRLAANSEAIVTAVASMLIAMMDAIILATPKFVELFNVMLAALVNIIVVNVPLIVDAAFTLITKFLETIRRNVGPITQIAIDIILKFIDTIASNMGRIVDSAFNLIISFINGLADTIRNRKTEILSAGKNIITALIDGATSAIKGIGSIGVDFVKGIIGGVGSMAGDLVQKGKDVVGGAVDGVKKFLGIKSPSRVMMEVGGHFGGGLVLGIKNMAGKVAKSSVGLGKTAVTSLNKAISKTVELSDDDFNINPVITPIVDLTSFNKSVSDMDSAIDTSRTINVSGGVATAKRATEQIEKATPNGQNGSTSNNTEVTFNQNITSPKALSQLDIYRQTKNQLRAFKREVKPA